MNNDFVSLFTKTVGIIVLVAAVVFGVNFAGSWVREELRFRWDGLSGIRYTAEYDSPFVETGYRVLYPPDPSFSILIPKIGVAKRIIKTRDPAVSGVTKDALIFIEGSSFPDERGTVFLIAHQPLSFFEKLKVNPELYLVRHLDPDDEIAIVFGREKFFYKVAKKEILSEFPSTHPSESNALFLVAGEPLANSWVAILAKREF